jgi:hypothetical protein
MRELIDAGKWPLQATLLLDRLSVRFWKAD